MTFTIPAIYENGAFRPLGPVRPDLVEGEAVQLTLQWDGAADRTPPGQEEVVRRLQAVRTLQEWMQVTDSLPPDDGGYDILKAMDENRRMSGGRPLLPDGAERQ